MTRRLVAEFFGTFWLVFGGCGSAIFAAAFRTGIGFSGVALAFGLTVLTMAYAAGGISGGHFNPAVSLACWSPAASTVKTSFHMCSAMVGAVLAGAALYLIVSGKADFTSVGGFASNGYGEASPGGYSTSALITEVLLTFFFLLIILGSTAGASRRFAVAIGLALTLIH